MPEAMWREGAHMGWWLELMISVLLSGGVVVPALPQAPQVQESRRVIVQFRLEAGLCETAPGTEPCQQSIAQGRAALLQELVGTSYQVNRVYTTIPFVALEVSPEALRILEASGRVVSIALDTLHTTQPTSG